MIFSYGAVREGHPGHPLLIEAQDQLQCLAEVVRQSPVVGVAAYKPPNSDAGSDLFIMDAIGMLGIPLVPVSKWPADADVLFLPTQAAADPNLAPLVQEAVKAKKTIIMTPGLLHAAQGAKTLAQVAGVASPVVTEPLTADRALVNGTEVSLPRSLDIAAKLTVTDAKPLAFATAGDDQIPLLTRRDVKGARVFVLNVRSYSQKDYDAVEEVLLAPRPLGLLELPRTVVNVLRAAFDEPFGITFDAGARITLQTLADGSAVIQNYQDTPQTMQLTVPAGIPGDVKDLFENNEVRQEGNQIFVNLPPRSRVWLSSIR